ncbi:MAG: hypothetical protein HY904_24110 [Deltaproteobacteria bacterium]|nr:hypothetical protein [Deltaproteobacteria bacterium]
MPGHMPPRAHRRNHRQNGVWDISALDRPKRYARMTAIAIIEDPEEIARYLEHTAQTTVHPRAMGPPDFAA